MNAKQTLHQANLSKWTARFHDQKSSGLTVKDWCSQNDVSIHAFYYWKGVAKETYVKSLIPDIVPIQVVPAASLPDSQSENSNSNLELYNLRESSEPVHAQLPSPITVSIGDIRIEIGPSSSDDLVSRIIKAVRNA